MEGYIDKGTVVHYAVWIDLALATSPGGFGYDELMLVHIAHSLVGVGYLTDAAQRPVAVPLEDREGSSGLVLGSRMEVEFSIKPVRIRGVRYHAGSVFAGSASDDDVGAGF